MKFREILKNYSKIGIVISGIVLLSICAFAPTNEPKASETKETQTRTTEGRESLVGMSGVT